ncbi:MAG: hypothetical protein IKS04_03460 [Clostridia bacterium]|nr:hypothetical protein [Clostridia bacterium]
MIKNLPLTMAVCLLLTVLIETAAAAAIGIRKKRDFINVVLVNIITNPVLVALTGIMSFFYGHEVYLVIVFIGEIAVFVTEGLIYRKTLIYRKINPFLVSLILNGASYLSGLLIGHFMR